MLERSLDTARRAAPFVAATLGLIVLGLAAVAFMSSTGFSYDFRAYDDAARRLATGGPLYLPGTVDAWNAGRYEGLYLYPPPLAVSLLPLASLDPRGAAIVWLALRVGMLVAGCLVLPVRREVRLALIGVAALSFPVLYDLNLGNVSIVLFFLVAVAWRWIDRPLGSIALAAAVALRVPFALVGIWWVSRRAWKPLAWWLAAGVALLAASALIVGPGAYWDYGTILRGLRTTSTAIHNLSLADSARALGLPDTVAAALGVLGYVVVLGATVWAGLRREPETGLVVVTTGALLAAPFLHPHYLVALLVPAAFLADRAGWWWLALPLLGWLPGELLPFVALGATVAPLAVGRGGVGAQPATSSGTRTRPAPSS